jgi:phenylacetate-CoA ligase
MALSHSNEKLRRIYYRLPKFLQRLATLIYSKKVERRRFGGVFSKKLDELIQNESLSLEERYVRQLSSLKEMLIHAGTSSPYYRDLFKEINFEPKNIQSVDDLRAIPYLEKDIIRAQHDQIIATNFNEATMLQHTSGTTGSALELTLSEEENQFHYACLWFHFGWVGIKRGDPIATFGGHPVAPPEREKPPFWNYDPKENDLMFSPHHLSTKTAPFYFQALADFNPVMIRGYPSVIYLIALYILETGNRTLSPKGIFTYAETILKNHRQVIEEAFGRQVYSSYGNGERLGHLLQCREGNFHEVTETAVIEVLRPDGQPAKPGEIGELVITSLINKSMPMIRYRIRDHGIKAKGMCKCGRKTPIFKEITGRDDHVIVTPDGRHLWDMDHIFSMTTNIKEAQLVQEKIDKISINVVPQPSYTENDIEMILRDLSPKFGPKMKINVQILDEIPRTAQGKYRFVVSKIPKQFRVSDISNQ